MIVWRWLALNQRVIQHAFIHGATEDEWSLCGMAQFINGSAVYEDSGIQKCTSCVRFAQKHEVSDGRR